MLIARAREVSWSLRAYITLSEDLSSLPSTHVRRFTSANNSSFLGSYTSGFMVTALRSTASYTDTYMQICILKNKC